MVADRITPIIHEDDVGAEPARAVDGLGSVGALPHHLHAYGAGTCSTRTIRAITAVVRRVPKVFKAKMIGTIIDGRENGP